MKSFLPQLQLLRSLAFNGPRICSRCQTRAFRTPASLRALPSPSKSTPLSAPPPQPYRPQQEDEDKHAEFIPQPLGRPIGFLRPPSTGENTGKDTRSLKQRRDELTDWDKHLHRREALKDKLSTSYFRDFNNMGRVWKGKTFLANPRIFKASASLYFPNFHGKTLTRSASDTTPVLTNKLSLVSLFSSRWAENQVASFVGQEQNPELHELLRNNQGLAQMVEVNVEQNMLKAAILSMIKPLLKKPRSEEQQERYFIVRKGVSDNIKYAIGLMNERVGYVYLVDRYCRIRWAGSGIALADEKESLVRGLKKMIIEAKENRDRPSVQTEVVRLAADVRLAAAAAR